ncbi:MAG: Na+/H+ antiporter NhaC family protein [Vicinamibacterales bacterium]
MTVRLPHPLILLLGAVLVAASFTWILPAGEYDRRDDAATGRRVVVAGTYHEVAPAPVGPFAAFVALPRGFEEGADVIAVILFVGGAWVVIDRLGTLARLVGGLVRLFHGRGLIAIPIVSLFFGVMGALENMQEEIIPLIPVLLVLGRGLGVNAVVVVAMSAGAAMIGSAFGPTNPFQAGIAMKLAELAPVSGIGVRAATFVGGLALWVIWTLRYAVRHRTPVAASAKDGAEAPSGRDGLLFLLLLSPMAAYVYGASVSDWGFNELSAGFFVAGMAVGLLGGLGLGGTTVAYLEGMQSLLPAAVLVGFARTISLVLADGRVIDTILQGLASPLAGASTMVAALLMIPVHMIIHVAVPSVSGQAVLTMPVMVPLSDLLGLSRQVTVLAYQMGAGLTDLLTPTNGALMAVLLAAKVPYQVWLRFALVGTGLAVLVGIVGMLAFL